MGSLPPNSIAAELKYDELMSVPKALDLSDWAQEVEGDDHSPTRFLEYSKHELEDLNKGTDEVFKPSQEESTSPEGRAQSTPIPKQPKTSTGIPRVSRSKSLKRNDTTPPSSKNQKKPKPPTDS